MSSYFFGMVTLTLLACEKPRATLIAQQAGMTVESKGDSQIPSQLSQITLSESAFKTVEWIDLMPEEDLEALLNPPNYVTDIEDGSFEDQISNPIQNTLAPASNDPYQQALASTRIIPEMDGQAIRIPGFIVPLEFNDEQTITQFFLVLFLALVSICHPRHSIKLSS